jgi:hypothetical protein
MLDGRSERAAKRGGYPFCFERGYGVLEYERFLTDVAGRYGIEY